MGKTQVELISELGELRQSTIICYLTSDRVPHSAQIASDVLPMLYKHLKLLGKTERISLFLFSNGGSLETPWPLVGLIREFCEDFEVIVPAKALSAATLIALGANRICMGPASYLSPIDPRGTIHSGGQLKEIEIENIFGFIDFAKEQVGLKGEEALTEALHDLTQEIDPTTLGWVNRAYHLIRSLARRLLLLHMNRQRDEARIEHIVKNLAQRLYSHNHLIYRTEARDDLGFGDCIEFADDELQTLMDNLYAGYTDALGLGTTFNPTQYWTLDELKNNQAQPVEITRAVVESVILRHHFVTKLIPFVNQGQLTINEQNDWREMSYA